MGMSYKRAWMLVETLNGFFRQPLVIAATGGAKGGGAALTPLGAEVLARFRRMEAATVKACAAEIAALQKKRADRKSVGSGKSGAVRVDIGGGRSIKKTKHKKK